MNEELFKKLQRVCCNALDAQCACNLSGVVRSWAADIETLWALAHKIGQGTDFVNRHPVNRLYAVQVAHLSAGSMLSSDDWYGAATKYCETVRDAPLDAIELDYRKPMREMPKARESAA